jgi:hypothetical protein
MAGRSKALLHLSYPAGLRGTSRDAKVVYTRLLADDALNHAGVLPLRVALWADECEMSEEEIRAALQDLEARRFAYTDWKTHQVLVRTLIRNDEIANIPNILHSACRAALNLRSEKLRRILAAELRKLAPQPPDKINEAKQKRYVYPDPHGTADKIDPGPPGGGDRVNGSHPASHDGSHRIPSHPSRSPGDGDGEGEGERGSCSVGTSVSSDTDASDTAPVPKRTRTAAEPEGFGEWYAAFPRHEARAKAAAAYRAALRKRGVTADSLLDGARRYARLVEAEGRDRSKILLPPSWLNGERWNDELPSGAGRDPMAVPDGQLSDEDVDEILGPGVPPEPPDEFEFWPRDRRHAWNRENIRRWRAERRERAIRVRAERLARVTRLDDRRGTAV